MKFTCNSTNGFQLPCFLFTKGRFAPPVNTARIYGPNLRPVYMGAFLTPICTARLFGGRKVHPFLRVVYTGNRHALPYIRPFGGGGNQCIHSTSLFIFNIVLIAILRHFNKYIPTCECHLSKLLQPIYTASWIFGMLSPKCHLGRMIPFVMYIYMRDVCLLRRCYDKQLGCFKVLRQAIRVSYWSYDLV